MNELEKLIKQIKEECRAPICISYEYDPTPTAEERLKNILNLIRSFENKIYEKI